jgi:hypothetical protein
MVQMRAQVETARLYEQDFQLWLEHTVLQLQNQEWGQIDRQNLVEELEAMGRSERHALKSNLRIILLHLVKYKYQASKRSRSWKVSIREHRFRVQDSLKASPSLKRFYQEVFATAYQESIKLAVDETDLPRSTFPEQCPFSPEQVLDLDYLPEDY